MHSFRHRATPASDSVQAHSNLSSRQPACQFQCVVGSSFAAPRQALCKTEIAPGRHVVLWSADVDKGLVVLCVDGKRVAEFSGNFGSMLAGQDSGRLGDVMNGIARNAVPFTPANGDFTGTIHSCTVWPQRSIF